MNKSYRSIWNPSLGCYVAAPESATAHSSGTSSARAVRSSCPARSRSVMALEPRILFDGAMLVTAVETDGEQTPEPSAVEDAGADNLPQVVDAVGAEEHFPARIFRQEVDQL